MAALLAPRASAITIQFDYSLDQSGFFGTAATPTAARTALEFAGQTFDGFFDSLAAIQPGGNNNWVAQVRNPGTGGQESIPNLVVPQDTLIVYAGARNLAGSKLGEAGPGFHAPPPGGWSAPFTAAVTNRGQGAVANDFAPWGGFIEFDTTAPNGNPRNWHFEPSAAVPGTAFDLYTVAVHELGHLLGFGTSAAFNADASGGQFHGGAASALYGGSVPLHADNQHWGTLVTSPPFVSGTRPEPALGPTLSPGERKAFTPLDYAGLADIGWLVAPELMRLPGDADGDHDTDGADFLLWQRNLGGFGGSPGDVNGDLFVDSFDGWMMRQNFGAAGEAPGGAVATNLPVPEPGASPMFVAATLTVVLCRRNRSF